MTDSYIDIVLESDGLEPAYSALVVDDCRTTRMILRKILEGVGFRVDEAVHGEEALERCAAQGRYDLATVDWNMPVLNGLGLIKALTARPEMEDMRILMISTHDEVEEMLEAITLGATDYLTKPFAEDDLREKLIELGFAV